MGAVTGASNHLLRQTGTTGYSPLRIEPPPRQLVRLGWKYAYGVFQGCQRRNGHGPSLPKASRRQPPSTPTWHPICRNALAECQQAS